MLSHIIKLGVLIIFSFQCYGQGGLNDSTSAGTTARFLDTTTTIVPYGTQNGTKPSIKTEYRWQQQINERFGNVSMFVSSQGFLKLLNSLGLKKKSNRTTKVAGFPVKCHTASEFLRSYTNDTATGLTKDQFMEICPTLLLQIHTRICRPIELQYVVTKDYLKIWLYSSGAVLVCSLVGLFVVWLIPILPKAYYNSISQLLIALAVGSLTGDALLHLIPHALLDDASGGHSHGKGSEKSHSQMVWKSLVAFIGIHIFFITERITILCQNLKSKRKMKNKQLSHENVYREIPSGDAFDDSDKLGVKFTETKSSSMGKLHWASKSRKYSSSSRELEYGGSHNGLDIETNNIGAHLCNRPKNKPHVNSDCPDSMNIELCHTINPYSMVEESKDNENADKTTTVNGNLRSSNPQLTVDGNSHDKSHKTANNQNKPISYPDSILANKEGDKLIGHSHHIDSKLIVARQTEVGAELGAGGATVMSSLAHPFQNKPHGHHHGHSHDLSSVKAIAYTVIAGDGLHNFCDGIAIGAAFANDLRGGLSTAIAVLCHELPHELGDFVVLLHAGMSFRTAIFYNLLSSIFCAAGMVIGVLLGAVPSVSSWIFMITAGMFLYIALVDMMPELSTRRLQGNKLVHRPSILFLWQNIGLILGAIIMLLIALYEESMF